MSKEYVIVGFRVPTTPVGVRARSKGSKEYPMLGFGVPTTSDHKKFNYHI